MKSLFQVLLFFCHWSSGVGFWCSKKSNQKNNFNFQFCFPSRAQNLMVILLGYFTVALKVAIAQSPSIVWEKSYGGTGNETVYDMCVARNGKIVLCGTTTSNDYDVTCNYPVVWENAWIFCVDTTGTLLWSRCYGGSLFDAAYGIDTAADGGFVVAAYTESSDGDVVGAHGAGDYWILRLDSLGNLLWSKCYGGSGTDLPNSIKSTSDHGYIINGSSRSLDGDVVGSHSDGFYYYDYWVLKIDSVGNIQWQKPLGGSDDDRGFAAIEFSNKKYLIGGIANSNDGDVSLPIQGGDFWIVMIDSVGNIMWNHSYGGGGADQCRKVLKTLDHKILLAGPSDSNNIEVTDSHGGEEYLLIEIDSDGTFLWSHAYGGIGDEYLRSISLTPDSGFVANGMSQNSAGTGQVSANFGSDDYWLIRTDKNGVLIWEKNFGGSLGDQGNVVGVYNNNIFISGVSQSSDDDVSFNHSAGGGEGWTAMIQVFTGVSSISGKQSFSILPNPADETISLRANINGTFELQIFNAIGDRVAKSSFSDVQKAILDVGQLSEGLYTITVQSRNFSATQKLIILHH